MKVTSNKDMLNAIRNQASEEYKEKIGLVDDGIMTIDDVQKTLADYPSIKNEFIQTLTNKVIRTDFFSKVYENPLKMLKKGSMPYGGSIEELFVLAAEAKNFYTNGNLYEGKANTLTGENADDLIKRKKVDVKALYILKNYAHYFETSISDAQLKAAFMSQNGLSEMVNQIVGSLTSGAEQKEYSMMKQVLEAAAVCKKLKDDRGLVVEGETGMTPLPTSITTADSVITNEPAKRALQGVLQTMPVFKVDGQSKTSESIGHDLAIAIRGLAGRMKFVSDRWNMAGVKTWSRPEDLVFLTTPEILAQLDVDVLAEAFNVSKAELNVRTILVDSLPTKFRQGKKLSSPKAGIDKEIGYYSSGDSKGDITLVEASGEECYGILMDRAFIQAIDTVNESRTFENGRTLTTNLFLHKQGMIANCFFANSVALLSKAAYTRVAPN